MEAAAKLNSLEVPKLSMLLRRFYYIVCASQEYFFTNEEKKKLLKSLNVSRKGLNDLLEIIKSILYECVQNTIQPMALRELLISKGMCESHAQVFSEQWAKNGKMFVDVMKKISAEWQKRKAKCARCGVSQSVTNFEAANFEKINHSSICRFCEIWQMYEKLDERIRRLESSRSDVGGAAVTDAAAPCNL